MNKQELGSKIWKSANQMRAKIDASDYKDFILGFIFYKYLSEKEIQYLKKEGWEEEDLTDLTEDDRDVVEDIQMSLGYFISYDNLFQTWINKKNDFSYSDVTGALSAFSRMISQNHRKVFDGIFDTLQQGLPKLGTTDSEKGKAVREIIHLIDEIPMYDEQDYDVLGYIYEYLLANFAANAGKKAGEFFTPSSVSTLISNIIGEHSKDKNQVSVYDPTSGSGSLLINIGKSLQKHLKSKNDVKYYAQELKTGSYNLTRMNLIMRGILPDNIMVRNADTLKEDWPYFEEGDFAGTYNPLFVDAVVSNPPYSLKWKRGESTDSDPRFANYGLAPESAADYAFLLHCLYHLKSDGIMAIVLPHGVLFRGNTEAEIRKNLIDNNNIDTIIGLPANIFYGTGIPTIIMILKKHRDNSDVLFIDASQEYEKDKNSNSLRARDIQKITETVIARKELENYSQLVSRDEIIQNDYNLNIPRYVSASTKEDDWDLFASVFGKLPKAELIDRFQDYWEAFPDLFDELFISENEDYCSLRLDSIDEVILNNSSVRDFKENFRQHLDDFEKKMSDELMANYKTAYPESKKETIKKILYNCFGDLPLIDQYDLYQKFHDEWEKISQDIETIHTDGDEVITKVIPRMIIKKVNGKDKEVQDGWEGLILPFDLIQKTLFPDELNAFESTEKRLAEIGEEYKDIIDSLDEDEKEQPYLNQSQTGFVKGKVNKALKEADASLYLKDVKKLQDEESKLKTDFKELTSELSTKTIEALESMTEDQALTLLKRKWTEPLFQNLEGTASDTISELIRGIKELDNKYSDSLQDLNDEINQTESVLKDSINDLTGTSFDLSGLYELQSLLSGV